MHTDVNRVLTPLYDCELKTYLMHYGQDTSVTQFVISYWSIFSLITWTRCQRGKYNPARIVETIRKLSTIPDKTLWKIIEAAKASYWLDNLEELSNYFERFYDLDQVSGMASIDGAALFQSVKSSFIGPMEYLHTYYRLPEERRNRALTDKPHEIRKNLKEYLQECESLQFAPTPQ